MRPRRGVDRKQIRDLARRERLMNGGLKQRGERMAKCRSHTITLKHKKTRKHTLPQTKTNTKWGQKHRIGICTLWEREREEGSGRRGDRGCELLNAREEVAARQKGALGQRSLPR